MDFEWMVPKIFTDIPEKNYINPCCVGCDEILARLKPEIASRMKIDEEKISIYQEDWGWAMEFSKDDVLYFLGISNSEITENETFFTVNFEANRTVEKFFFTKKIEAVDEQKEFGEMLTEIAKNCGFELNAN